MLDVSMRRRVVLTQVIALAASSIALAAMVALADPSKAATGGCPHNGGAFVDPVWSPDGKQIAWVLSCKNGSDQIWVASSDGSNAHVLTGDVSVYQLAWVPGAGLLY